jgi:RHS repeat-associated protein
MFGRFHSVSSSVQSAQSVVEYSRLADTDLLSGRSLKIGNSLLAVGYSYESARSLITSVENSFDSAVVSRYDYANDELGRRTHIERSGVAFGDLPVRDAYEYNPRSEVVSAHRTPVGSQTELRGFSYDYAYDPIGNRIAATEYDHEGDALVSEYTANALNQYEQRTVPGYAGVRGEADTNATVTVNADPAWRWGGYFYGGDEADNSADADMKELEITATYSNLFTSVTGRVFVAETPESFQYDDDGNLTQDGRFTYTWDAENRMVGVTTRDDLPTAVPRVKVDYLYDHQSRRIAAATAVWTNDAWQAVENRSYLYDGWNVVTERTYSQTHTLTNLYTWGLDLSGSLQGAGGIGGLLAVSLDDTTTLYCYDANGNVGQLVSPDGELLAHYEYSPFGETLVSTGPLAKANPFRFSTKHWDDLTGLGYWGYRYYHPDMGRWLSRDPLGEVAFFDLLRLRGPSVTTFSHAYPPPALSGPVPNAVVSRSIAPASREEYLFTKNDPVDKTDLLGLDTICFYSPDDYKCKCPSGSNKGKKQKGDKITDGCSSPLPGPWKDNPSGIPGCSFLGPCDAHDCCYGRCGSSKAGCDVSFCASMYAKCLSCAWWSPYLLAQCNVWAGIYCAAVSAGGGSAHDGNQQKFCEDCCCP